MISWLFLCFRRMGLVALAAGLSCVGGWEVQFLECAEAPGCLRVLPWGPSALLLLGPGGSGGGAPSRRGLMCSSRCWTGRLPTGPCSDSCLPGAAQML